MQPTQAISLKSAWHKKGIEDNTLKKCGLCGEEIKENKYFTIYQCKGTESRLVLMVCEKDFKDEKYREIIMKISSM